MFTETRSYYEEAWPYWLSFILKDSAKSLPHYLFFLEQLKHQKILNSIWIYTKLNFHLYWCIEGWIANWSEDENSIDRLHGIAYLRRVVQSNTGGGVSISTWKVIISLISLPSSYFADTFLQIQNITKWGEQIFSRHLYAYWRQRLTVFLIEELTNIILLGHGWNFWWRTIDLLFIKIEEIRIFFYMVLKTTSLLTY